MHALKGVSLATFAYLVCLMRDRSIRKLWNLLPVSSIPQSPKVWTGRIGSGVIIVSLHLIHDSADQSVVSCGGGSPERVLFVELHPKNTARSTPFH